MTNLEDIWRTVGALPRHDQSEFAGFLHDPFSSPLPYRSKSKQLIADTEALLPWEREELKARLGGEPAWKQPPEPRVVRQHIIDVVGPRKNARAPRGLTAPGAAPLLKK